MTNTEQRIKKASDAVAKSLNKLATVDPEMAKRMTAALAREMDAIRAGR